MNQRQHFSPAGQARRAAVLLADEHTKFVELNSFKAALVRIEAKLDKLIAALAEDEETTSHSLEGQQVGAERDQTQGL